VFQELEFFEADALEFECVEAAHVCYMGDGDMFKMEDVGDEKANSWNAMCISTFTLSVGHVVHDNCKSSPRRFSR
jgi:hypothetical protein